MIKHVTFLIKTRSSLGRGVAYTHAQALRTHHHPSSLPLRPGGRRAGRATENETEGPVFTLAG